jgi:hypothetical protein
VELIPGRPGHGTRPQAGRIVPSSGEKADSLLTAAMFSVPIAAESGRADLISRPAVASYPYHVVSLEEDGRDSP